MVVVEPAKLPRKAITDVEMPAPDVLKRKGCRNSLNSADANDYAHSFEEHSANILKKFFMRSLPVSVSFHPNVTMETPQTNHQLESGRMKRTPRQCVTNPVMRCERNRKPGCLLNIGCKGRGSCGGTCREVPSVLPVLRKGVPGFVVISIACVCA